LTPAVVPGFQQPAPLDPTLAPPLALRLAERTLPGGNSNGESDKGIPLPALALGAVALFLIVRRLR
jgi:hypothetical protein